MSDHYEVSGSVELRDCPEAREIIEKLRGMCDEPDFDAVLVEYADDDDDAWLSLELNVNQSFVAGGVLEFDELLKSLGPYAVAPGVFETEYAWEPGDPIVVAPAEEAAAAGRSKRALGLILEELPYLVGVDREKVLAALREGDG